MAKKKVSNYKIMACFDTETSNDDDNRSASAICYQLSRLNLNMIPLDIIDNDNVKSYLTITIDRHFDDVCARFEDIIEEGLSFGIVPVIMVHNLAFEMWILSSYFNRNNCEACCKSTVKPLTITIIREHSTVLEFWDTLSFWGKGLEKLGDECGYPKLSGCWDYSKQRTPDTELTDMELAYAEEDVVVPWAYLGYYLRLNPEIDEHDLANKILTKTSVVRYKSTKRCGGIHVGNKTTGYMWLANNRKEKPKTDFELSLTHAATRGGFTYCSRNSASKVYKATNGYHIYKYDANSMHICHALAHYAPSTYRECGTARLQLAFDFATSVTVEDILNDYNNPFFNCKFYGCFYFTNVRLKEGTVFYKNQVSTFAESRFNKPSEIDAAPIAEENEGGVAFSANQFDLGWHDWASDDAEFAFGKFYGASECRLILNELSAWEFAQQFDYDYMEPVGNGFLTGKSVPPTDKVALSFNEFYKAKNVFKGLKYKYEHNIPMTADEFPNFIPIYLRDGMITFNPSIRTDVESFYLSVKAELNALYGIEATNEAKNDIIITKSGLKVGDYKGVEALPHSPKAWYQYGTHIVGWSRIHQIIFMLLLDDIVDAFICGDTDSHKIYTKASIDEIAARLQPLHIATEKAVESCTVRARKIRQWYPMEGLGFYEYEGSCDEFLAGWNKSYIQLKDGKVDITLAGIPCNNKFKLSDGRVIEHSYNNVANWMLSNGYTFEQLAPILIGYNVYVMHGVTGLNSRSNPEWCSFDEDTGEPHAIYLYPMTKVLGDTRTKENHTNCKYAIINNPSIPTKVRFIDWDINSDTPKIIFLDVYNKM